MDAEHVGGEQSGAAPSAAPPQHLCIEPRGTYRPFKRVVAILPRERRGIEARDVLPGPQLPALWPTKHASQLPASGQRDATVWTRTHLACRSVVVSRRCCGELGDAGRALASSSAIIWAGRQPQLRTVFKCSRKPTKGLLQELSTVSLGVPLRALQNDTCRASLLNVSFVKGPMFVFSSCPGCGIMINVHPKSRTGFQSSIVQNRFFTCNFSVREKHCIKRRPACTASPIARNKHRFPPKQFLLHRTPLSSKVPRFALNAYQLSPTPTADYPYFNLTQRALRPALSRAT